MIIDTDGYHALIEYLVENLALFEQVSSEEGGLLTDDYVTDMVANHVMAICEQNPQLETEVRFALMKEADRVVEELHEILSNIWNRQPTAEQQAFLSEFIDLIKNMFDAAVNAG
ncbi:DUF3802 family protein [Dongshaea marina]|uniref:DUF3802 family protein n=1 Tax=Dongshaea marina TaxID=2047966 RepID=UPI000D3E5779|nr:DUF3802 family protein [Dongshaea marina]